jgi:hypothetical protein
MRSDCLEVLGRFSSAGFEAFLCHLAVPLPRTAGLPFASPTLHQANAGGRQWRPLLFKFRMMTKSSSA